MGDVLVSGVDPGGCFPEAHSLRHTLVISKSLDHIGLVYPPVGFQGGEPLDIVSSQAPGFCVGKRTIWVRVGVRSRSNNDTVATVSKVMHHGDGNNVLSAHLSDPVHVVVSHIGEGGGLVQLPPEVGLDGTGVAVQLDDLPVYKLDLVRVSFQIFPAHFELPGAPDAAFECTAAFSPSEASLEKGSTSIGHDTRKWE